jgi:hypothetical protein
LASDQLSDRRREPCGYAIIRGRSRSGRNPHQALVHGCHLVAADQKAATTDAPTFSSIAKRPDFDPAKIEFFLRDPHPKCQT